MEKAKFDFKFLNLIMYIGAAIAIFYVLKNLGITEKISKILVELMPVFIGIIICWISRPLASKLKKMGLKDQVAAIISLIIIFGILVLILSIVIPMLVQEIGNLIVELPNIYNNMAANINEFLYDRLHFEVGQGLDVSTNGSTIEFIKTHLTGVLTNILDVSINTIQSIFGIIISIFTIIVVAFFMVKDMDKFKSGLIKFLTNDRKDLKKYNMIKEIDVVLMSYIKGMLLDSFIVGVLTSILCFILGIKYAIIFGILIMVLNLIPYIGALLSEVIIALFALSTGGIWFALLTFALLVGIQIIDANILQPNIVAKSVNLHPIVVFSGLIIFNLLMGMIGMIIAVPVIAALKIFLKYMLDKSQVKAEINN